ncbi:hypothetical protein GE09DRAFT_1232141 [Coniochaeta sp. 2T2.1]|nr:hypothetical protein GE09DRAFT_1232141 [Coniochaeta sp. 2T2.1]
MHPTLFTTALVAVLSLAGTLIGTNGAPAAIAPFHGLQSRGIGGSPGKGGKGGSKGGGGALDEFPGFPGGAATGASGGSSWGQAAAGATQTGTKTIVDPTKKGYYFKWDDRTTGEGYSRAKVWGPEQNRERGDLPNDILGYEKDKGIVVVFQANNVFDTAAGKLSLRDILLGMWKTNAGAEAKDLKFIRFENVGEQNVKNAIDKAYAAMGKTKADTPTLTVSAGGTARGEAEAFDVLVKDNAFGNGAQKMVNEYQEMAGRKIAGFTAIDQKGAITFIVNLS